MPAVVTTRSAGNRQPQSPVDDVQEPAAPPPANDDTLAEPAPAAKSAIVTSTSRKRGKLLRFEQAAEPDDDPEATTARVKAFFARMIRPRDP